MLAARFHRFGDPSVLRVEEVPRPRPRGDEVLVRVRASSVNGTDLGLRGGALRAATFWQLPLTPGFDISGEVVACGPQVTAFEPGDPVFALVGHGGGGAAEYALVRQGRAARAPANLPLERAAAVPLAGLTALQGLRAGAHLHLKPGLRALVNGASGGIGAFAVQLARLYGARVTGVARPEKHDFVRGLGADEVVGRDWQEMGERWDVIFDTAAALRLSGVRSALARTGVLVSVRGLPAEWLEVEASAGARPRFFAVRTAERGLDLAHLARLIDAGELRVPVDREFPLYRIAEAHRYAEGDALRGKVVVTT